jgi:hypothetical protein
VGWIFLRQNYAQWWDVNTLMRFHVLHKNQ